jgi:hypothetical protein
MRFRFRKPKEYRAIERNTVSGTPDKPSIGDDIALTIVQDGQTRQVTVRELCVGNKLAGDALLSLLIDKGIITAEEFQERIRHLSNEHYKPGTPE